MFQKWKIWSRWQQILVQQRDFICSHKPYLNHWDLMLCQWSFLWCEQATLHAYFNNIFFVSIAPHNWRILKVCDSGKISQLVWNDHARICGGKSGLGRQPGWRLWRQHFFCMQTCVLWKFHVDIADCDLKLWSVQATCWTPERGLSDVPHFPSRFWSFLQYPVPFWWNLQARMSLLPGNFVILGFSPESGKKKKIDMVLTIVENNGVLFTCLWTLLNSSCQVQGTCPNKEIWVF